MDVELFIIDIW